MVKKENNKEEFIRKTKKVGNSAGVILPKKLLGCDVKISIIKIPINIKKEAFKLLEDLSEEIMGFFLLNKNPFEILAVSEKTRKIIKDKIKINVVPLSKIKKDIQTSEEARARIIRAEPMMNNTLLKKLKQDIRKFRKNT